MIFKAIIFIFYDGTPFSPLIFIFPPFLISLSLYLLISSIKNTPLP